jgi:hypothetical protein
MMKNNYTYLKIYLLVILLFFLSILWFLLFPAISISTNELKPRGLYVDEHAFMVHQGRSKSYTSNNKNDILYKHQQIFIDRYVNNSYNNVTNDNRSIISNNFYKYDNVCNQINYFNYDINCDIINDKEIHLTQIIINSIYKQGSLETNVIVIPFNQLNEHVAIKILFEYILRMSLSNWLSKSIIILLLPLDCNNNKSLHKYKDECSNINKDINNIKYSNMIELWLKHYHDVNNNCIFYNNNITNSCLNIPVAGLIRESFVLDLSSSSSSSTPPSLDNNNAINFNSSIDVYNGYQLLVSGSYGQIPNMDLVSSILTLLPSDNTVMQGKCYMFSIMIYYYYLLLLFFRTKCIL